MIYLIINATAPSFYSEVYNCNQTKEGEMNMKKKILLGLVLIFRLMDMGLVVDNLKHM